jgi:hypothetical protein
MTNITIGLSCGWMGKKTNKATTHVRSTIVQPCNERRKSTKGML